MPYNIDLLAHLQAVSRCLPHFEASATVNAQSFSLELTGRGRHYRFHPQFLCVVEGRVQYALHLQPSVRGFIGWLPYVNRRWPAATGKHAFKQHCREHGLNLPPSWQTPSAELHDFIIKQDRSSFGYGIRGPFRRFDPTDPQQQLAQAEYYERFIPGTIVKAWFVGEKLACLETRPMPVTTGNGRDTILQLLGARGQENRQIWQRKEVNAVLDYQDLSFDTVLPDGQQALFEFRYGSPMFPVLLDKAWENTNILAQKADAPVGQQLAAAGPAFARSIPQELRRSTVYTVDAILDEQERVWFLEMNCNPIQHPDVYRPLLEALFGPPKDLPETSEGAVTPPAGPRLTPQELLALAALDAGNGRLDEALGRVKTLIGGAHVFTEALPLAARLYARLRKMREAQECYRRYLAERPDALLESFELGVTLFEIGEREQARQHWRALLQRSPRYPPALFYSGLLEAQDGNREEARLHLEVLLRAAPSDDPYALRGTTLLRDIAQPKPAIHGAAQ